MGVWDTPISKWQEQKGKTHDINGGMDNMYTADNIRKMMEFLIGNTFVGYERWIFCLVIGIPMGKNCASLLADLSFASVTRLYSLEVWEVF